MKTKEKQKSEIKYAQKYTAVLKIIKRQAELWTLRQCISNENTLNLDDVRGDVFKK